MVPAWLCVSAMIKGGCARRFQQGEAMDEKEPRIFRSSLKACFHLSEKRTQANIFSRLRLNKLFNFHFQVKPVFIYFPVNFHQVFRAYLLARPSFFAYFQGDVAGFVFKKIPVAAKTLDELKTVFAAAHEFAKGDRDALRQVIASKDAKKKALTEQAAAAQGALQ